MSSGNASMGAMRRCRLYLFLFLLSQALGAQAACTTLTTCAIDEVEVQGPTWTSDRVCARVAPTTTAAPEPEVVVVSTTKWRLATMGFHIYVIERWKQEGK